MAETPTGKGVRSFSRIGQNRVHGTPKPLVGVRFPSGPATETPHGSRNFKLPSETEPVAKSAIHRLKDSDKPSSLFGGEEKRGLWLPQDGGLGRNAILTVVSDACERSRTTAKQCQVWPPKPRLMGIAETLFPC